MRTFLIKTAVVVLCISGGLLQSQERTYTQKMDSLMQYVDKSQMTTPILYDRVFSFTNLDKKTPNNVDYNYFIQAWSELYRASTQPNFSSVERLKAIAQKSQKIGNVQLGIINLKYNYIDYGTDANPNLVFENGFFRNVAGKNPFKEKEISLVAPLVDKITSSQVHFVLDENSIAQTPNSTPIQAIQVNFGNGQTQTISLTQNSTLASRSSHFSTKYTSNGTKNLTFKIIYANGVQKAMSQKVEVQAPELSLAVHNRQQDNNHEDFTGAKGINATIPFQGYDEPTAKSGKLEYSIYYRNSNKKLHKPIIVLDGYDPGDKRKLHKNSLNYDKDHKSIYEMMLFDIDNSRNLVTTLQKEGFDVVLVNFPNGADFIERNAMAVIELIKRLNITLQQNGSTEQLTLIGPSMGGLISRYALAYMEKHNMPHNTKLWVSFDSPHHGANIPISLQRNLYFFGFIGGKEAAKDKWIENFNSPAARQMLIEQMDAYPYPTHTGSTHNMNNQHPFRQQFLQNLTNNGVAGSNGFPTQTRNIAITNGTTNGQQVNTEGQTLLELAAFGPLRFKAVVIVDNTLPPTNLTYLSFEGRITNVVKCRLWPSNMTFTCGVEVSNGKVYNKNINPNGSMDVVQGGTFNTQGIIKDEFHPQLQQAGLKDIQWRRYNPNHSFIPTVSALAFKNPNFDWNSDISRNLLCGQEIPFDSYFVPQENEEHIKITSEMVSWLTKEIKGQAQKPNLNLAHITPNSTKKVVCKDETFYVSIDETNQCNMPSNYSWSTSEGLQIVGNNNSAKIQVKALKDGLGYVYANFSNGQKVPIKIWIGKPQVHYETEPMGYKINYLLKSSVSDANLEDQGIIKYNCDNTKFTGNGYISSDCVQGSMRVHRSMDTNWSVYRNTIVTNSCGTSNTVLDYALPHPPCDEYNFVLSDNNTYKLIQPCFPNILSIEKKLERINDNLNIHIIDFVGNIVINTPNKEFSLSHLLPGTYYARIIKNGEIVYTQTLLKK